MKTRTQSSILPILVPVLLMIVVEISLFTFSSCGPGESEGPQSVTVMPLDTGWRLKFRCDGEWLPATVPGCVHTDLLAAGVIPDPFFGENEKELQWVGDEAWFYECRFSAPEHLLEHNNISLEFDGLDTYARVLLNDSLVIDTDNMFRSWKADIKPYLKPGKNRLKVVFSAPGYKEAAKRESLGYALPGGDRVFTRKAAYHYGWDWGPRLVTCGIWRPVRIVGRSCAMIAGVSTEVTELTDERAVVRVDADIIIESGYANSGKRLSLNLIGEDRITTGWKSVELDSAGPFERLSFDIELDDPEPWWPAGLGGQRIYDYRIELCVDGATILDTEDISFGLRTIDLVTDKDDAGETFYFRVNGVPVFMKGANWIPAGSFLPDVTPADYRRLLVAAKDANMNMLRVWGGGIYENEIFYDLCDSLGIVVWQDFMYACAMYPGDREFLDNAGSEAVENINRLRRHPCVALWCGNNESDEGWRNWGWQGEYADGQREEIESAYRSLFESLLPSAVELWWPGHESGALPYHPSSPRFGRADPRSLTEGDAHYWGVWHDAEPFEVLEEKIPRFMSEFGFQSLPSMRTIEMFAPPDEMRPGSPAMLSHQKHPRGFELIEEYMERWYRVPEKFEDYVYVSQLLQAEGMRLGLEAQRRAMPYCMGTLYWQLNDCWPAISWSSVDYAGEWKALHYAAKRAFEPVLVSTAIEGGSLDFYVVSDRLETMSGRLSLRLMDFFGKVLYKMSFPIMAPANGSARVLSLQLAQLLPGRRRESVLLHAVFSCEGEETARTVRYFAHPKELDLPRPKVTFKAGGGTSFTLTSKVLARNVYLELDGGGHFSDNFFDILPGEVITVDVKTEIPPEELESRLRIRTLRDTY